MSANDKIAPIKRVRIKQRTEPWIDLDVLNCIKDNDSAFYKYKNYTSQENWENFRALRNKAQSVIIIIKSKQDYFKDTLESNKNDPKSLSDNLKSLGLPSTKGQSSTSIGLNINGEVCFDKLKVAEKFNSFYTSVAADLVAKLPKCLNKFGRNFVFNYYSSKCVVPECFGFSIVAKNMILKYLSNLSSKKATGLDGIPAIFVKDSSSVIA